MNQDLPADRLRIRVRALGHRRACEEYGMHNLPEAFEPYMRQAMEDLSLSGNPTNSRSYKTSIGDIVSVWYKPRRRTDVVEFPAYWNPDKKLRRYRKIRVWP